MGRPLVYNSQCREIPNGSLTLNIKWRGNIKTYEITTTETLTKNFRVKANSEEQAWKMAETDLYADNIEFVDSETENEEIEEINEIVITTN